MTVSPSGRNTSLDVGSLETSHGGPPRTSRGKGRSRELLYLRCDDDVLRFNTILRYDRNHGQQHETAEL